MPGRIDVGSSAWTKVGVTEKSGSARSPDGVAISTCVDCSTVGNDDGLAEALATARFWPEIAMMLPGPSEVYGLNVMPSTTELELRDGAETAVSVNVTDTVPALATTFTVPGIGGRFSTVLAMPAALVTAVRVLKEPPPLVMAKVTEIPASGACFASETMTCRGMAAPVPSAALFP